MAPLLLGTWHGIKGAEVGKNRGQHLLHNRTQGCRCITSAHTQNILMNTKRQRLQKKIATELILQSNLS